MGEKNEQELIKNRKLKMRNHHCKEMGRKNEQKSSLRWHWRMLCSLFLFSFFLANAQQAALNFDGVNDNVQLPNMLSAANGLTIEYWLKTDSTYPDGVNWYYGTGVVDAEVGGSVNDFGTSITGSKLAFGIGNPDQTIKSTSDVNTGNWIHIVATWNRADGKMKLYINGILEATGTGATNFRNAPANIRIGTQLPGTGGYFKGTLDEVRIWSRALCQSEIQYGKNNQLSLPQYGLVAYYPMNEGIPNSVNTGLTTLADNSGNAINGTLSNFALSGDTSNWVVSNALSSSSVSAYSVMTVSNDTVRACDSLVHNGTVYRNSGTFMLQNAAGCDSTQITLVVSPTPTVSYSVSDTLSFIGNPIPIVFKAVTNGVSCTYQWYKNGIPVSGADTAIYSTTDLADGDQIYCVVNWGTVPCISTTADTSNTYTIHLHTPQKWYVKVGATGSGTSWATAGDFQTLINGATMGDSVFVAAGTYTPATNMSYSMKAGVKILGGFPASGSPTIADRDYATNVTVLRAYNSDNRVMTNYNNGLTATSVLDGFTITGGGGYGRSVTGAGMYNYNVSPVIQNCIISGNRTQGDGGGVYNSWSSPTFINCTFSGNTCSEGTSSNYSGGGMANYYSTTTLINCTFSGNYSYGSQPGGGGGVFNKKSNLVCTDCTFDNNRASYYGGAVFNTASSAVYTNCRFFNNRAFQGGVSTNTSGHYLEPGNSNAVFTDCVFTNNTAGIGGVAYNDYYSIKTFTNCVFYGNTTPDPSGGWGYGSVIYNAGVSTLTNCVLTGNVSSNGYNNVKAVLSGINANYNIRNTIIYGNSGSISAITYSGAIYLDVYNSLIQDGIPPDNRGNINGTAYVNTGNNLPFTADPLFVDGSNPAGADGIWGTADDGLRLQCNSPCVNTGNNAVIPAGITTDVINNPRIYNSGIVDMGAYEYPNVGVQRTIINQNICQGDTYVFGGQNLDTAGTYYDTLQAVVGGCDSIIILNLTIKQPTTSTTHITHCGSYTWNGTAYDSSGTYTAHLINASGCDSAATLNLTIRPLIIDITTPSQTLCLGDTTQAVNFSTHIDSTSGTICYIVNENTAQTITAPAGAVFDTVLFASYGNATGNCISGFNKGSCHATQSQRIMDSLALGKTSFTITPTNVLFGDPCGGTTKKLCIRLSYSIPLSTVYVWTHSNAGIGLAASGTGNIPAFTASGTGTAQIQITAAAGTCSADTIVNIAVTQTSASTTNDTACDNYTWNGTTYNTSGTYTAHLTNAVGCDSTATLNLIINYSTTSITNITAAGCYTWNGTIYDTSGTYTAHFINSVGCDSAAVLHLTVNKIVSTTNVTAGGCYTWNGTTYNTSGAYTKHFTVADGCDSAATLHLTIKPLIIDITNPVQTLCLGETTQAVNFSTYFDSIVGSVCYIINENSTQTITAPEGTVFNAVSFASYGNATGNCVSGFTQGSCHAANSQSVVKSLALGNNSFSITASNATFGGDPCSGIAKKMCVKLSYAVRMPVVSAYTWTNSNTSIGLAASGTDSIVSFVPTNTGTAQIAVSVAQGTCVADTVINLIVNQPTASTTNITADGCYFWNGNTYDTSGTYIVYLMNAAGCDSAATLNLTIHPITSTTNITTSCSIVWNGNVYDSSGTYVAHFTAVGGCDSTAILNLTVNRISYSSNVVYVDSSIAVSGDGSSWVTAFKTLSEALDFARYCAENIDSILIARGTYYPTGLQSGTDRSSTFLIPQRGGIKLYGGFNSSNGSRDIAGNPTILSGDIGTPNNNSDNSFHVFIIANINSTADSVVVDGVTIRDGYAGNAYGSNTYNTVNINQYDGGGICVVSCASHKIVVSNCIMTANSTREFGAGMYNENASPIIIHCRFISNTAPGFTFGGGMANINASPYIAYCTFAGNGQTYFGGGMYNESASPTITNCAFTGNEGQYGGGIYNESSSSIITNCTIAGNKSEIYSGGGIYNGSSSPVITNCIIWGNTNYNIYSYGNSITINNSIVTGIAGGNSGTGNSSANPQLVNAPSYTTAPFTGGDYRLQAISPAINMGNNSVVSVPVDLDGNSRIAGGTVDAGAYEVSIFIPQSDTACESYTFGSRTYTVSGTYANAINNDSLILLSLVINHNDTSVTDTVLSACSAVYTFRDSIYTKSGTYYYKKAGATAHGCDSIYKLNVTIHATYRDTVIRLVTDSFVFNGHTYTSSGFYADTLYTAFGCDSIIVTNLSLRKSGALSFDGADDYVQIPNPLAAENGFTIEYWLETASTYTGNAGDPWYAGTGVVDAEMPGSANDFGTAITGNKLAFGIGNTDITITSVSAVNTGNWLHVAATWNKVDGAMKLYINGILESTGTGSTDFRNAPDNIKIGTMQTMGSRFNGKIDELRIWNRALCQTELQYNMNSQLRLPQHGLVAYYPFNQGIAFGENPTETSLIDSSGNSNNGTLNNFALRDSMSNWVLGSAVSDSSYVSAYGVYRDTVLACTSYIFGDDTLTKSGTYNDTLQTVDGCDSIIILKLIIHQSTHQITNTTAYQSYQWRGTTYTASGTYTNSYTNDLGCASVDTLNLTISGTPLPDENCEE